MSGSSEDDVPEELRKAVLEGLEDARQGRFSKRTVQEIFDEVRREAGIGPKTEEGMPTGYDDARDFLHSPASFRAGDAYGELLDGLAWGLSRPLRRLDARQTMVASNLAAEVGKFDGRPPWTSGLFRPVLLSRQDVVRPAAAVGMKPCDPSDCRALPEPVAVLDVADVGIGRLAAMQGCGSVRLIAVFEARKIGAAVWSRGEDGGWTRRFLESPEALVDLGVGSFRLGAAYRRMETSPSGLRVVSVASSLPPPLPTDATEDEASVYAGSLAEACRGVFAEGRGKVHGPALPVSGHWLDRLEYGHVVDAEAAGRAKSLWLSVEAWKESEKARNPRYALRELMSGLSEDAWHASWQPGVEDVLWDAMVRGDPTCRGRMDLDAATLDALRSLHMAAGGWWRWGGGVDGGLEFLTSEEWTDAFDGRKG